MKRAATRRVILLTGIPASGKSTFAHWLKLEKGFLHLDVEKPGVFEGTGLQAAWNEMFSVQRSVDPFLRALHRIGRAIVIDWGFPPEWLLVVSALKDKGIAIWWFDGDRAAARESFVKRGTVPLAAFEVQMAKIENSWEAIKSVFGSQMVQNIKSGGSYEKPEKVSRRILK